MSFAGRLIHRLAIVTPGSGDPENVADLDSRGMAEPEADAVELVFGLVQPRRAEEVAAFSQAGVEISDVVIYLTPRQLAPNAYLADADDVGLLSGGRRFDVVGVRDFAFGRSPHLEVDCRIVGSTEAPLGS